MVYHDICKKFVALFINNKSMLIMYRKKFIKYIPLTFVLLFIPNTAVSNALTNDDPRIEVFETGLIDRMKRGKKEAKKWSIEQRLIAHEVPGVSIAIIEKGKVIWSKGYGTRLNGSNLPINSQTVFSVGSVSKMVNAALILRLVSEGKLDLDKDVNIYLKSWKVPKNIFTNQNKVTLRAILSHTAGFSQHGFRDFQPHEKLPSTIETLMGISPAKHKAVRLQFVPGERMAYSGGGITVSQLLVEDVTGLSYEEAASKYVFEPLGMTRSTFVNPLPSNYGNIARAHDEFGKPAALPRGWESMPEMAASGLWTSANDLAAFNIALLTSGKTETSFLSNSIVEDMMTRVSKSWHGLGPRLNGEEKTRVFHHGGANDSYRAWIEGHLNSGNGIVVLTNGTDGHWIHSEVRKSAEDAFGWVVKSDGGFEEPDFSE
jgi:CubicO group peptidase (beta-lactamase class C family)